MKLDQALTIAGKAKKGLLGKGQRGASTNGRKALARALRALRG